MAGAFGSWFGTMMSYFKIGGTSGVRLKNSSGNLLVRNTGDSADAEVTTSMLHVSGDTLELNSDAAGSAADWKLTIGRPAAGMSANWTLTLPTTAGSANQVLQTDGSGNTVWATASSTAACTTRDTTSLVFGSTSPVAMFTLPANAVIEKVVVIVDTAFNGTAPTISVGIAGTTSKYIGSSDVDLKTAGQYIVFNGSIANGSTEALIITYAPDSSSAGAARVLVDYSVPA
jgi:hypothetical protein